MLLAAILAGGCSQRPTEPGASERGSAAGVSGTAFTDPGIELPPGAGREILLADCLGCHDLGGLDLFASFYTREDWRTMVLTMAAHGATIDAAEVEQLADYLALHFGPAP
jgi:mono/diheme cytochrome c family protein